MRYLFRTTLTDILINTDIYICENLNANLPVTLYYSKRNFNLINTV